MSFLAKSSPGFFKCSTHFLLCMHVVWKYVCICLCLCECVFVSVCLSRANHSIRCLSVGMGLGVGVGVYAVHGGVSWPI